MKKLHVLAAILLILTIAVAIGQFAGTSEEYSRYNTGWNGTSDFFGRIADSKLITDAGTLANLNDTTLLVVAPSANFTGEGLSNYLDNQNTLIILDQDGNANSFLQSIGSTIAVHNEPVRSVNMEYRDTGLFRAETLVNIFGTNVTNLFFNYPTYVTGGTTVVQTSPLAWVDTNGDNTPNANETLKVYSLITSETIKNGKVIVVADPSLLVNNMLNRLHTENMAVLTALLDKNPYIYGKETMTENGGGIAGILSIFHRVPMAGVFFMGGALLIIGAIFIWRWKKEPDDSSPSKLSPKTKSGDE